LEGNGACRSKFRYLLVLGVLDTTALLTCALALPASANSVGTNIQCGDLASPSCTLSASSTQTQPSDTSPPVRQISATTAGANTCEAPNDIGTLVPCDSPAFGWLGSTGCYYKADPTFVPPPWDTALQHPVGQAGSYYDVTCTTQNFNTGGGIVWLPSGAGVVAPVLPAPAVLAQQAVQRLLFPGLTIEASPSTASDQLVGLPSWLWLDQSKWHPITATAAVPGESVTATATPMSTIWDLGDGDSITCQGPGTPYVATTPPDKPSPTCGYTYSTSSAGQPESAFVVTTTVLWSVDWVGGGQTGTVPTMSSTTTTELRVADVESLNTSNKGV
jgi:hypothetical protein